MFSFPIYDLVSLFQHLKLGYLY